MGKLYEYNVKITMEDGEVKEKRYKSKQEIEEELGIKVSAINNILSGQSPKKFSYLVIERLPIENLEEKKKLRQKEYLKNYYEKKNLKEINAKSMKDKVYKEIQEKVKSEF